MKLKTTRESISEILGHSAQKRSRGFTSDLFSTTLTGPDRVHQVFRLIPGKENLPLVVIPADSDLEEFFATIATFYSAQSPITAFVHVLGRDLAPCLDGVQSSIEPTSDDSLSRGQLARLGACLGETVIASLSSVEGAFVPSYSACRRSLGYALARTVALYPGLDTDVIVERWVRLRSLTGLSVSRVTLEAVQTIHSIAENRMDRLAKATLEEPLADALLSYFSNPDAHAALEHTLLDMYPGASSFAAEMEGSFDSRMSAFLKLVESVQRVSRGIEVDAIIVGFYCNKILPGSFVHGRVLARLIDFFPSAIVWYGAFCSASPAFNIVNFGNGIVAKLYRDVYMSFSFAHRPQCDLSLDELEILMRAPVRSEAIKPIQQKIASVSLIPGLDVFARFSPDEDGHIGGEPATTRLDFGEEKILRATRLLEDAVALLHDFGEKSAQRSFPASSARRSRKR